MPGKVAAEDAPVAGPPCTHTFGFPDRKHAAGEPPNHGPKRSATRIFSNATFTGLSLLEEVACGQITNLGLFPCRQRALKG